MHPVRTAILAAARARRGRPQEGGTGSTGPRRAPGGAGRLLLDEIAWAVRQAVHPVKMGAAALVAVGVGVALGPTTPGPVLGAGWRLAVSTVLGMIALAVAHALLGRRARAGPAGDALDLLRVLVAAVTVLLVGTLVLGHLLAVVTGATGAEGPDVLHAALEIDGPLLGGAALLGLAVLSAGLTRRIAVPTSLLVIAIGMAIGSDGLGLVALDDPQLVQSIGVVALVVILFDGGLSTTREDLRLGVGPGLALATVGVAVTAGITAVGAMVLLDVPSRVAWLIGAVVASTDATAVFALLRRTPVTRRLAAVLRLESGANDPVAVLLTVGLLSAWDAPPTVGAWLGFGALQLLGGVAVGVAIGWVGATALRRADLGSPGPYPILALAVAGVAYGAAVLVGASGFLATYVAGVVVAEQVPRRRGLLRSVLASVSGEVEVGLFLLLGLLVLPGDLPAVAPLALGITALLVLVARPVGAAISLAWFDLPAREVAGAAWLGMRGAVPIVLATLASSAGIPEAATVFHVVFFVVITSALLQGTTAGPLVHRLGLGRRAEDGRTVVEALPLEVGDVDVVEVALDEDSPLVGRVIADCAPPEDVLIAAVVRGGRVVLPRGRTRLHAGDRLLITTTDRAAVIAVEGWSGARR